MGCEGKIISEVLVSGFEGEKKNLRVLCCLGCGGKAENCVRKKKKKNEVEVVLLVIFFVCGEVRFRIKLL